MNKLNEQMNFWANEYAREYVRKNNQFDQALGAEAWKIMLKKAEGISSLLECGSNIGRNISFLESVLPEAKKSIIELNKTAYDFMLNNFKIEKSFNGPIVESNFNERSFDLVFTCGVLIHIHPDDLLDNMQKMFQYSSKYILVAEYFNRTPVMIEYQGQKDKLFKRDFGKLFIENFNVKLVDYGFIWGHIYDKAGFDDITWWLFEKRQK